MNVLVAGGAGYIGSHTVVELLNAGSDVVIVDNLYNSKLCVLDRIEAITGKRPKFYKCDLLDLELLDKVFSENPEIDSVIHFAGLKAVGESCRIPLKYYHNNLTGTFNLIECMNKYNVNRIVFSSSATVYGENAIPFVETMNLLPTTNPYGESKVMSERILQDVAKVNGDWSVALLRYFNPIGAHESGRIGEDPQGIPNNLMPYVTQVASGKREYLRVWGDDYPTVDGTGVRDYIHVVDLARAHLCALDRAMQVKATERFNIGTGKGYSVLDIVKAFEKASGVTINYQIVERRPGDVASLYADTEKAKRQIQDLQRFPFRDVKFQPPFPCSRGEPRL